MLKIGIIDSGISRLFIQKEEFSLIQAGLFQMDWSDKKLHTHCYKSTSLSEWIQNKYDLPINDDTGHGTAVASILHKNLNIPAEFYIAKTLDEKLSGSSISVYAAISWLCEDIGVDYLNISLGTNNFGMEKQLSTLINRVHSSGCHIYSAAGHIPTLPSELENVISVGIANTEAQKNKVKVDENCHDSTISIFDNGIWRDEDICTSYACPLILSRHCNKEKHEKS